MVEQAVAHSSEATVELGRKLAAKLKPGDVVAFFGDLGSGKTTMIKGIASALGVQDVVRSPSFVVATEYAGTSAGRAVRVQHVDLYRLRDGADLASVGFADLLTEDAITLIEWADRAKLELPPDAVRVDLVVTGENERRISITSDNKERLT